jgi:hypothetical protein
MWTTKKWTVNSPQLALATKKKAGSASFRPFGVLSRFGLPSAGSVLSRWAASTQAVARRNGKIMKNFIGVKARKYSILFIKLGLTHNSKY